MLQSMHLRESRERACELKFLVGRSVAGQIRQWARAHLERDTNGTGECGDDYTIASIYFDTVGFDVFQRNGSFGRAKYRIRRYGTDAVAFLERKLKTRGLVSKRRTIVPVDELSRLSMQAPVDWIGRWYHRRLLVRMMQPICEVCYHRTARVGVTPLGLVRLTVDEDLRAVPAAGLMFNGSAHGMRLLEDQLIVELKFRGDMPALFKELVEGFALNPKPISKYRTAVTRLGLAPRGERNDDNAASACSTS